MVTVVEQENPWAKAAKNFGEGVAGGYQQRADEMALQKSIEGLGDKPTPRQIIDAVTKTKTYLPESKQNLIKNYLGAANFEELQKQHEDVNKRNKESNDISKLQLKDKAEERRVKDEEKKQKNERAEIETEALLNASNLPEEQKRALKGNITPASARSLYAKAPDTTEYEIAKNQGERFKKTVEHYQSQAIEAENLLPITEASIINNEAYSSTGKAWDTLLDTINSPLLNTLKTKTGQQLESYTPISIASFGQKMSGQLTNRKIELISKKAIGLGKDKDANRLFLYLDYYNKKLDLLRVEAANEIIAENKFGLPPKDFDKKLNEKMKPYQKMIASDIDRLLSGKLPNSQLSELSVKKNLQAKLAPGEILVVAPDGSKFALPEEDLKLDENKDLKRVE